MTRPQSRGLRPGTGIADLVAAARERQVGAVARLISLMESEWPFLREVAAELAPHAGRAQVVGLCRGPDYADPVVWCAGQGGGHVPVVGIIRWVPAAARGCRGTRAGCRAAGSVQKHQFRVQAGHQHRQSGHRPTPDHARPGPPPGPMIGSSALCAVLARQTGSYQAR
jgi:hypothetical protein